MLNLQTTTVQSHNQRVMEEFKNIPPKSILYSLPLLVTGKFYLLLNFRADAGHQALEVIKMSSEGKCLWWGSLRLAGSKLCWKDVRQRSRNNKHKSQLVIQLDLWDAEIMSGRGRFLLGCSLSLGKTEHLSYGNNTCDKDREAFHITNVKYTFFCALYVDLLLSSNRLDQNSFFILSKMSWFVGKNDYLCFLRKKHFVAYESFVYGSVRLLSGASPLF